MFQIRQQEKTLIKGSSKQQHTRKFTQQTTVIVALVFVIGIIFTTAPAYAQAITSTEQFIIGVVSFVGNSCNGDIVRFSGNQNIVLHTTQDASGGIHIVGGHSNLQGVTGIGELTGNKYRVIGAANDISNIREDSANEFTFLAHGRLISQGNQANQLFSSQVHVTFNANGEITAEIQNFSFKCT